MNSKIKRILVPVILVLLAVIVTVGITSAWLSSNRQTASENLAMQILAKNLRIRKYQVFQCNESNPTFTEGKLDTPVYRAVSANADGQFVMKEYDSIFTDINDYHGLILAVELFSFPEGTSGVQAAFTCSQESGTTKSTSNLIFIGYQKAGTDFSFSPVPNTALHTARAGIQANTENLRFCNLNSDGTLGAKNTAVSFGSIPLTSNELAADTVTLLFLIDYDKDLVKASHIDPFGENTDFQNAHTVFLNDLTSIVFEPVIS